MAHCGAHADAGRDSEGDRQGCTRIVCDSLQPLEAASDDVAKRGLTTTVTYQTKNGGYTREIPNPNCLLEVRYFQAMMKAATKFGLNPLDRERITVSPFEDDDNNDGEDYSADDITFN